MAIETANRVDDSTYLDTISGLEDLLNSHTDLTEILSSKFVQEQTSVTGSILKALTKIVDINKNELTDSGGKVLNLYSECYNTSIDNIVRSLNDQCTSCSQTLAKIQTIIFTYPDIADLEYDFLRTSFKDINLFKTMLNKSHSALKYINRPHCPKSFLDGDCSSTYNDLIQRLAGFPSLLDELVNNATANITNSTLGGITVEPNMTAIQIGFANLRSSAESMQESVGNLSTCLLTYPAFLTSFQSFLYTVDNTTFSQSSVYTGLLDVLYADSQWMRGLIQSYRNGSITKELLSRQFIDAKDGRLLLNVQSVMNSVSTYFVSYVSSKIALVQGNMLSTYTTLISYLNKLRMLTGENDIELHARELEIWRKPIFNYDEPEVRIVYAFHCNHCFLDNSYSFANRCDKLHSALSSSASGTILSNSSEQG